MADELGVPASTLELTITAAARRRALLGAGSRSRRLSEAAEVILVFTVVVENAMQAKNITDTAAEGLSTAEDAGECRTQSDAHGIHHLAPLAADA